MSANQVCVVGTGAAGLTAAIRAAESGARVLLLNAHPKVGLKILMSGGTRCNVTHREVTERDFNGEPRAVVARILRAFTPEQTRQWFESLGVQLKLEETGKYFPETDDAQTVLDALLGAVSRTGVELWSGARAVRIERLGAAEEARAGQAGYRLGIQRVADSAAFVAEVRGYAATEWPLPAREPDEWLEARAVILASGGLSFPRTGSDGTGYALAAALGHTIVPPVPALTPLAAEDRLCRTAQGVTLEAELTLRAGGRRVESTRGSFLFAHFGYSGPAALDLSRHWHRAAVERSAASPGGGRPAATAATSRESRPAAITADRRVEASFLPGETRESLLAGWMAAAAEDPKCTVRRYLGGRLPDRLVVELCTESGVEPSRPLGQVERERRGRLFASLLERDLGVTGTLGYEKAEVTAAGVPLAEVEPSTLESRRSPGLYLCGEILDVEGRLGGFNFQFAWSSGTVAGRAAASN